MSRVIFRRVDICEKFLISFNMELENLRKISKVFSTNFSNSQNLRSHDPLHIQPEAGPSQIDLLVCDSSLFRKSSS